MRKQSKRPSRVFLMFALLACSSCKAEEIVKPKPEPLNLYTQKSVAFATGSRQACRSLQFVLVSNGVFCAGVSGVMSCLFIDEVDTERAWNAVHLRRSEFEAQGVEFLLLPEPCGAGLYQDY
jgi:hypothetical protein